MSSKTLGQAASSTPLILTPKQAAALLNLSTSWLAKQRLKGDGPAYIKMGGAVRYNATMLQEWMKAKQRLSTSGP
jgi:predicted DNA-binding transcriptional regulator AlpA